MYAWITCASGESRVDKVLVLARSLRQVRTGLKLVVIAAPGISEQSRGKLTEDFDLVVDLPHYLTISGEDGEVRLEMHAKIHAFSLLTFDKFVYLSPETLVIYPFFARKVLKNCDDLFDSYAFGVASYRDGYQDLSVVLLTPSLQLYKGLLAEMKCAKNGHMNTNFIKCIEKTRKVERLNGKYNVEVSCEFSTGTMISLSDAVIVNFVRGHPLDFKRKGISRQTHLGILEKYCLSLLHANQTESKSSLPKSPTIKTEPIAIVGWSFRLPGGNTPDALWNLMIQGKHAIHRVPPHRWTKQHTLYTHKDQSQIEAGFLDCPIDAFDTKFFGISSKEAAFLDPQQRLLHEVSWEALENAGIDPCSLHGTQTGIYVGSWIYNYKDIAARSPNQDFFRIYMGNSVAATSARLSHFFGTTGPSIATESGCSATIVAVDMASKALRSRDIPLALAAGVNLLIHPYSASLLEGVFAPDFRCKTFDASANGFVRAEAVTTLVMKRLSDAIKDGDSILGLLRGSGITQEGVSKSLGTPTIHSESLAMKLALEDGRVDPLHVDYIETHGTGTPVGDPLEVAAINKAYYTPDRKVPLVIGSVKTNIGHTESASGIAGIIKVLLSMKHEKIPPHLNLETVNPDLDLNVIPLHIPLEAVPWPKQSGKPRIAGVSSFGISGTDGHVIVQEPPEIISSSPVRIDSFQERPLHLMKVSAKCAESFEKLLDEYENLLEVGGSPGDFADIAYSANTGRGTFTHRGVVLAENRQAAAEILRKKAAVMKYAQVPQASSKLCFLFPGQGCQYRDMAKELYSSSPVFHRHFDNCDKLVQKKYQIFIQDAMWGEGGGAADLNRTLYSQICIFCVEYCLLKLWASWGLKPDFVLGHSLGEFCAAVAAGILEFDNALDLVVERSRLIDALPEGKMLVVKAPEEIINEVIYKYQEENPNFWADYAALNSPEQSVLAGDSAEIEKFAEFCKVECCLKTIVLASSHAFHSRHMDPILEAYGKVVASKKIKCSSRAANKPDGPIYISGMEGKVVDFQNVDASYWVRHTREKVRFMEACQVVQSEGCSLFLEIGPHPILSALTMMNMEGTPVITCLPSLRRQEGNWTTLLDSLSKLYLSNWKGSVNWKGFDRGFIRNRVPLPNYPFNRKPIWAQIKPEPPSVHPLIGKVVPNGTPATLFENEMTVARVTFSQDHVFGNTVVFPGAGFLEMCLAAGYASAHGFTEEITKPRRAIGITDLKIGTPLALSDMPCVMQTVTKFDNRDNDNGFEISVLRYEPEGRTHWIPHATANFQPVVSSTGNALVNKPVPVAEIQEFGEETLFREFYEKVGELGLRFGPKFQSLEIGWRHDDFGMLAKVKVPEDNDAYLIHPVVADAMLQAAISWSFRGAITKKKLQVPIGIGKFVLLDSTSEDSQRFVYCWEGPSGVHCSLVDSGGKVLAWMSDIEFVETTLKMFEGLITQQGSPMPKMWEEVWRPSPGPLQNRVDLGGIPIIQNGSPLQAELAQYNEIDDAEESYVRDVSNATRWYVLEALYGCGWEPELGMIFTAEEITASLGIRPFYTNYIRFFLRSLASEGILEMITKGDENSFWFRSKPPPARSEIEHKLGEIRGARHMSRVIFKFVVELGGKLAGMFRGELEPLPILFPEDPSKGGISGVYEAFSEGTVDMVMSLNDKALLPILQAAADASNNGKGVLRVLEIGAGTGVFSRWILSFFDRHDVRYEYHYTDISASFFGPAEKLLGNSKGKVIFKKLNMEEDPLAQGFCPGYFDMLLACEVLHVAKDLKDILRRVKVLLKPGGLVEVMETIREDPTITFIFGLLEGYWQFQDFELRPHHATLSPEKWGEVLEDSGFVEVACTPTYGNLHGTITAVVGPGTNWRELRLTQKHCWVLFGNGGHSHELEELLDEKLSQLNRRVEIVSKADFDLSSEEGVKAGLRKVIQDTTQGGGLQLEGMIYLWGFRSEEIDQRQVSLPFFTLVQLLEEREASPKVFVVTKNAFQIEDSLVGHPSSGSLVGMIRSINNENPNLSVNHLDLCVDSGMDAQVEQVFSSLWMSSNEAFAFRGGTRFSYKLASLKIPNQYLSLPHGCERYQLSLPPSRQIADLEFTFLEQYTLEEDEIEVEVKATGLNFRDILTVLKPVSEFESYHAVGVDFAGVVTKLGPNVRERRVGDRVLGTRMERDRPLPSHIKMKENLVLPFSDRMTFTEGATLGLVFLTTYYSLVVKAKIKKGDTILVHTASGGVGLCAIQFAKLVGANVLATAGSKRKRAVLKRLGVGHVFNSRTTEFGSEVLKVTAGRGVDIVLNTLTGPGFKEASLDALATNGQFIELSVLSIWTTEEVKGLRPDVDYHLVDLSKLTVAQFEELGGQGLRRYLDEGLISPIPYERFDALNIRSALTHLQKAKHVGKVVCVMPDVRKKNRFHGSTPLFNEDSTYLVTGGLGGIGFELVKWILGSGGKHVVIASRSPPNPPAGEQIASWNKQGYHVSAFQVDVGSLGQCRNLFERMSQMSPGELGYPALRGVFHCAGLLKDALIQNQNWDTFHYTFNPKVYGSWNLHELTKELLLEHFVLFSSISATVGSPGQANHSSSNSFEDSLAYYRRSIGLPATSINYGVWGEVGVATEIELPGLHPMSTAQGILSLETFLRTQRHQGAVANFHSFALFAKMFPRVKTFMEDQRLFGDQKQTQAVVINSDHFWSEVDKADSEGKRAEFKRFIKIIIKTILKSDPEDVIDDNVEFSSIGVDSLMMLELKNGLQNVLGGRMTLTAGQLKDCSTVNILSNRLVDILEGKERSSEPASQILK